MADATNFSIDSLAFVVANSVGQATGPYPFEVSTTGVTHIQNFVVSAVEVSGNAAISGTLTVGGKVTASGAFLVSAISSLTGAVVMGGALTVTGITSLNGAATIRGAANFITTVDVGSFLAATVTIGVSSLNPLVATRYLQVLDQVGAKIFVPFVSVLPT